MKPKLFHHIVPISLAEGSKSSDIEVLRVGTIQDRGLKITEAMIDEYIKNFKENVYGTELQVNLEHNRGSAAAGWIKDIYKKTVEGVVRLYATVNWTALGIENVTKDLFKFVSAELANNYPHHQTGKKVDNVFIGLALTNTPALKGQSPIALSEEEKQLFNSRMLKTLLGEFRKRAFVSKADKALIKTMLDEAPEEEKTENKAAADEVEAKPEAPKEEPKKPEEALTDQVSVQKFKEMQLEVATLREKDKRNIAITLADTFMLSDSVKVGFAGAETKTELVDFLLELSPDEVTKFKALLSKVSTIELATKGKTATKEDNKNDDDEDDLDEKTTFIAKTAAKLMSEGKKDGNGKTMDIEACQKFAAKEWDDSKK